MLRGGLLVVAVAAEAILDHEPFYFGEWEVAPGEWQLVGSGGFHVGQIVHVNPRPRADDTSAVNGIPQLSHVSWPIRFQDQIPSRWRESLQWDL